MTSHFSFFKVTLFLIILLLSVLFVKGRSNAQDENTNIPTKSVSECRSVTGEQKIVCLDEVIDSYLANEDIKGAFQQLSVVQSSGEVNFDCHGLAHNIGEKAYEIYAKKKQMSLPAETSFCGYGFYHGFMEKSVATGGKVEALGAFCAQVKQQLQSQILSDACFHGVGHGALTFHEEELLNDQNLIDKALVICDNATTSSLEYSRCASGVFMEVSTLMLRGEIAFDKNDPLKLCLSQQEKNRTDCYSQLNGVLIAVAESDFHQGARYIEQIEQDGYAIDAIETFAAAYVTVESFQKKPEVQDCRALQPRLQGPCIKGVALAFMLKGTPGKEYNDALTFCRFNALLPHELTACFDLVQTHSHNLYPQNIFKTICQEVPPAQRNRQCQSI